MPPVVARVLWSMWCLPSSNRSALHTFSWSTSLPHHRPHFGLLFILFLFLITPVYLSLFSYAWNQAYYDYKKSSKRRALLLWASLKGEALLDNMRLFDLRRRVERFWDSGFVMFLLLFFFFLRLFFFSILFLFLYLFRVLQGLERCTHD